MELKNENKRAPYFFSRLGRNLSKENLILYRLTLKNQNKRPLSVSKSTERIRILYNMNNVNVENKDDDNENNIFSIEEKEKQKIEEFADNIEEKQSFENTKKQRRLQNFQNKKLGFSNHKFHFNMKKENKNKIPPSCTKYNPKYDIILKKSVSPPSWKSMQGRKYKIKRDDFPFYLKQELIQNNMAGKSFIDFAKQTPRKNKSINFNDKEQIYLINISKISKNNKSLINQRKELYNNNYNNSRKQNYKSISDYKSTKNMTQKDKQTNSKIRNIINKNSSDENEETNNSNDSFDLFRHIYAKKLKKKNKKKNTSEIIEKKIKSIDFDQIISREDLEEVKNRHSSVVPYLFPNFSQVRERPIMMVIYDAKKHKKFKRNSEMDFPQFNTMNYDKNKKEVHSPNFDFMNSRIYDEKDPYPSYMKRVFNKSATFKISDKSLKENNYSERGFIMPLSSFWKNNSFNKYINLKLLKSQKHLMESFLNNDTIEPKYKKLLKFYNKNYKYFVEGRQILSKINDDINKEMELHRSRSLSDLINDLRKKN